ncbi:VOC family protein [Leptospira sp. WS39.C2]
MLEKSPRDTHPISLYSVNLAGGEDCSKPLHFYQSILGGKVLKESFGHAELEINSGLRIVFSKETEHCPVRGGTLTLSVKDEKQLEFWISQCKQIQSVENKGYALYEDIWGNWIWIYVDKT